RDRNVTGVQTCALPIFFKALRKSRLFTFPVLTFIKHDQHHGSQSNGEKIRQLYACAKISKLKRIGQPITVERAEFLATARHNHELRHDVRKHITIFIFLEYLTKLYASKHYRGSIIHKATPAGCDAENVHLLVAIEEGEDGHQPKRATAPGVD